MAGALAPLLFCTLQLCFPSHALPSPSLGGMISSNATTSDVLTLLSFKSMLSGGSLASWNASNHYCRWPGVTCGGRRHPKRVVALRLRSYNLSGCLSPFMGNLSFLRELDLGDNHLAGQIPPELGRLARLQVLNLSVNFITGSIPVTLGGCSSLVMLHVRMNNLQGEIPRWLPNLTSMGSLSLVDNILSDAEMVAHVGDFGLAKILVETSTSFQQSTSSMGFRGTIGYAPPEYGAGNMVSTHGDIYSYGILILETVTGKRPTDSIFVEGLSIRQYVELGLCGTVMDVVDTQLSLSLKNELQTGDDYSNELKIDCLISLLRLGLSCSQEMPSSRMATADILTVLHAIKESLLL